METATKTLTLSQRIEASDQIEIIYEAGPGGWFIIHNGEKFGQLYLSLDWAHDTAAKFMGWK